MGLTELARSFDAKIAEAADLERRVVQDAIDHEVALRLRAIWAECDALADQIATVEPTTCGDLVAYATAFEWLEGGLPRSSSQPTEQIIEVVMTALLSMRPQAFAVVLTPAEHSAERGAR